LCPDPQTVTALLHGVKNGDQDSLDRLIPLVYSQLRQMADKCLRNERPDHTLEAPALVHELYLRLVDQNQPDYQSRAHFYGVAARIMRQILVDHARGRAAGKRGNGMEKLPLDEGLAYSDERAHLIVALDDSLNGLNAFDPHKARLVEMKFFGGLTADEAAEATGSPVTAVRRDLRLAQAWLRREMDRPGTAAD
jgi:RNA polymerase sigma-70 factor (ECF subfamily)